MKRNAFGFNTLDKSYFVICIFLITAIFARGQRIEVKYEIRATSEDPSCESLIYPGQTGKLILAPGIQSSVRIPLNDIENCDNYPPCLPPGPALVEVFPLSTNCYTFEFLTSADHPWLNNVAYGSCDSENPFLLYGSTVHYSGAVKVEACGNSLPPDGRSRADVWYEPPLPPHNAFAPPLQWSWYSAHGAYLTNIGPTTAQLVAGTNGETVTIRATCTNACTNCFVETTFNIVNQSLSGCAGKCNESETGKPLFGEGSIEVDGINLELHLGSTFEGETAGSLLLRFDSPTTNAFNPFHLKYYFAPTGIEVLPVNAEGEGLPVRQIRTPQGLVVITNQSSGYDVVFYAQTDVGPWASGGYKYSTNSELVKWQIRNPDNGGTSSNRLRVTKIHDGSAATWNYRWLEDGWGGWALTNADGAVRTMLYDSDGWSSKKFSTYSSNGTLIGTSSNYFALYGDVNRLTVEVTGTGSDSHINTFDYYENGMLRQMTRHDGYWEFYVYDALGRTIQLFSAFGTQGVTTNRNLCRLVESSYETNVVSGSGDAGAFSPMAPRQVTEYLLGHEVSRRYQVFLPGENRDIRCVATNVVWNDINNLVTITKSYTNGFFYGYPRSVLHPNGTLDLMEYTWANNTTNQTNTVWSGVPGDTNNTDVIVGTKTVTVKSLLGELVSETTTDIQSTFTIARQLYGSFDVYGRPQAVTNLDGTFQYSQRFCCGDIVTTNREGTVTTKTYDVMNRLLTTTTVGITHSNVYDAAGNILKVIRIGTDNSQIVLQQDGYDTAGHLFATTNAIGDVTLFAESVGASGSTNTTTKLTNSSSGPQRIEARFLDGQTKSSTGGLAHPVRYEYGPTNGGTFTKEIKLDANSSDTGEWTIQLYDTAGRPYKTLYADGAFSQTFYNSAGQVSKEVDPDGVTTLYLYNAKGERSFVVLDMDRDGTIDWAGTDRITWTTNHVLNNGSAHVHRTETRVWATNSENVAMLLSQDDAAVNGLTNWSTRNGLAARSETRYLGSGVRYAKSIAPDDSFTTTRFEDRRAVLTTRTNGSTQLSATTFAFDEHGRQQFITDTRNGTATNYFDNADRVMATATPGPGNGDPSQGTGYRFDALGRIVTVTNADNTLLYKEYFDSGELKKTWGAREYPVEYTYDAQGRMTTMKTWQDFAGNSGTAITSWTNDAQRGWLKNKRYADGKGPDYAYTAAGRLYQRTWARGVTTTYATNAAGEIASIDYSDSTLDATYTYDRLGRRTTIVDGAGTHVLSYELDGQLLSETNTAGLLAGVAVTNGYDALHRRFAVGLVGDSSTIVNYGYDGASRLIGVTNGVNTASYSYLANSPLISQVEFKQSGTTRMTTTKSFDYLNRLTLITNAASASGSENSSFAYAHNSGNKRIGITNADGSRWFYAYDSLGQVTNGNKFWSDGTAVLGQQFGYAFDDIGNRRSATSGGDANERSKRTQLYTANNLNQYTQRTVPGYLDVIGTATNTATVTVSHGATSRKGNYYRGEVPVGNSGSSIWQSITNTAVLASGTNDYVTNWVGNTFVPRTPELFVYDADGNMTNDGRWSFTWNGENRLIKIESLANAPVHSSNRLTFVYDQQGRRVSKVVETFSGGAWSITLSNHFAYDGWNLLAELNATNNAVINSFMWGLDLSGSMQGAGGVGGLLAITTTNAGTQFVGFDGNGAVAVLVSATSGNTTANYEYDPFGNVLRATGPMALLNPFRFSTKYTDGESGFNYYGYRFYNAAVGRWLNQDPINEAGLQILTGKTKVFDRDEEVAIYCFVKNEAVSKSDILGLGVCAPLLWRAGCVEFVGCSTAQLDDFRLIPEEETGTMTTPSNGWHCDIDGFWHKGNLNWFKVPGNCYTRVTCALDGGFSTDCCCNACLSAIRWVFGKASCGYHPNSGSTSIDPHKYPF